MSMAATTPSAHECVTATGESEDFGSLSRRRQLERLRRAALGILPRFGIDPESDLRSLRLVNHEFNTTYRVDTHQGRRYALRINVNSSRSVEEIAGEVAWVGALAADSPVRVPRPIDARAPAPTVRCDGLDRELAVVMYEWIDAPNLADRGSIHQIGEFGRTAARLHDHTTSWRLPDGTTRPIVETWMMDSADHLAALDQPWWTEDLRQPISAARRGIDEILDGVLTARPTQLIHGDLHGWNAKWIDRSIAVFDFDDCAITSPVFDLAISAFYLRARPDHETALLEGYATERDLPYFTADQWEALLTSRSLLLLNDVVSSTTSYGDDFAPAYADRTARRMRHYLDTGRFAFDPPSIPSEE